MDGDEDVAGTTRRIAIPDGLRDMLIEFLGVGARAVHCLRREYMGTLGDLDGVTEERLLRIDNLGPVTVAEIIRAVEQVCSPGAAAPGSSERDRARRISIPEALRPVPIRMLDAIAPAYDNLAGMGVVTLGDLDGVTEARLLSVQGIGPVRVAVIFRAVQKARSMTNILLERYEPEAPSRISIPRELHALPIEFLDAGVRAVNCLHRENMDTLGDLDGVTEEQLFRIDNVGPITVAAIFRAVEKACSEDDPVRPASRDVPAWLRGRRMPRPQNLSGLVERLAALGIDTVGDIWPWSDAALRRLIAVGWRRLPELRSLLYAFEEIGPDRLAVIARPGWHPKLPAAPLESLRALIDATTPAQEILALVAGVRERDAQLWLRHACFGTWPRPSMGMLAVAHGLSREWVRQILDKLDAGFAASGVRLPICSCIVQWIADRPGGTASTAELLALADEWIMEVHKDELRALPRLASLDLVPDVAYDSAQETWRVLASTTAAPARDGAELAI